MKTLALLVALLILLAPMLTRAGGPKCEPPNPPDDYQLICPEFGSGAPFPYEFDPNTPPDPAVWDPNHPSALPPPCPEGSQPSECMSANPVTIDKEPLPISVSGGVAPFTWTLTGDPGFTLEFSTTQDHNNILHPNNACGTATIQVTDSCSRGPQTTEINVKSLRGQWNQIVPAYCAIPGAPNGFNGNSPYALEQHRVEGKYYQRQLLGQKGVHTNTCGACDEFANNGPLSPCHPEYGAKECITIPTYYSYTFIKESSTCQYYIYMNSTKVCTCYCINSLTLNEWGCP